ncbi:MAG: AAA family ATPase, partial [Dehalococcoidia bacterium]
YFTGIERRSRTPPSSDFPWSLPLVRDLEALSFTAPVTFLVGENGSGKSTLLEGLAAGLKAVAAGSHDLERDETLKAARSFADGFRFIRRTHAHVRLFLRAEDVFGFTRRVTSNMASMQQLAEEYRRDYPDGSEGQRRAVGMATGQSRALASRYGADPDARSHGETFLNLLTTRLVPRGLYFLDEPETPLSPSRVLSLLALLKVRVAQECQFIIATHSPLLMAFPGATILLCEHGQISPVAYDDVEHVRLTRDFLNGPERFLRHL